MSINIIIYIFQKGIFIKNWTDEDINYLKEHYTDMTDKQLSQKLSKSIYSIHAKSRYLNLSKREFWTNADDQYLINNYSQMPINEIMIHLNNRTRESIINRARKLHLHSIDAPIWTIEQDEFIKNHWELMSDYELGINLNKTKNAVKRRRNLLGVHRQDKNQITYDNIAKYIRGNIWQWKKESMEQCHYQCVLTNSKQFEIHHLYPVNQIINDIFIKYNISYKEFNQYTQEELNFILSLFIIEQNKYPLGECIRKDLHVLFHSLYGQYSTTPEQWNHFKENYKRGLYNDYINKDVIA